MTSLKDYNMQPDVSYGGANKIIQSKCPRCKESVDSHRIKSIKPAGSESLLEDLQRTLNNQSKTTLLDEKLKEAYLEVATGPRGNVYATSMMGAAKALIGSQWKSYITLSGPGPEIFLSYIQRNLLSPKTVIISDQTALEKGQLVDINGKSFTPVGPVEQINNMNYPLGSCAAQKLLNQIFKDARDSVKSSVESICMSEMLWRDYAAKSSRTWATGQICPPCDTCKQILPQMLCDKMDE